MTDLNFSKETRYFSTWDSAFAYHCLVNYFADLVALKVYELFEDTDVFNRFSICNEDT